MSGYPNLKGVADKGAVEQVKAGSYSADYINWSRTMQLLRDHAPGWLPEMVQTAEGGYVHRGGVGGFLLIRFVHEDGTVTPGFPQAIMDNRNQAIPVDKITARDITDTHRRGLCMAAALAFGLAYELWAKMPLESGHAAQPAPVPAPEAAPPVELAPAEQVDKFWQLVEKVAAADPEEKHTVQWWRRLADMAAEKKHSRAVAHLDGDELAGLAREFQEHYGKLKGSGGDSSPTSAGDPSPSPSAAPPDTVSPSEQPQPGTDGPAGAGSPSESVPAAEGEPLFKAPTGPRGSKRKEAA